MQKIGFEHYSVLGWSDGGISGLLLAAQYPECVRKLVVWGANAYLTDDDVRVLEKVRDLSTWKKSALDNYLQVYDKEYFQKNFDKWSDAIKLLRSQNNGELL